MSAWIRGSEIAASLVLLDFEFAREFVAKGLQPHNGQGQPYMPAAVVNQFIQGLEQELAQHEDTASNLSWGDRDEIIANHVGPLNKRIHGYRLYLESLNGTGWNGFELPQDQEPCATLYPDPSELILQQRRSQKAPLTANLNQFHIKSKFIRHRLSHRPKYRQNNKKIDPSNATGRHVEQWLKDCGETTQRSRSAI